MKLIRKGLLACAIGLGLTTGAFAHARLESAVPAANATVSAAPTVLALDFSEAIEPSLSGAKVTDSGNHAIATGTPSVADGNDKELLVPIIGTLSRGSVHVAWHALALDGHETTGTFQFTIGD
ncbi:Copper resistance protein C precursor [Hartmannibacter diazotrophicus]|uniref:Copper resistance protein C n=1 Tax=Hartmannibacter diazotrophicus TaxID=1482074 RepID=A0A2C9D8T6_9HYPH|nr:copper homeostasis periplasmic binding protein CopC [Hartmannibacter diazotrophicus]SON56717.1 Copper resistance protein C precursor [Hartmannibacter diazotrophicus]